jgi:DNA-binding FadR family transcriptional regulator
MGTPKEMTDSKVEAPERGRSGSRTIRRRKLFEDVVRGIEDLIRDEGLAPGDQLPSERELMATFDVGRSAVREALLSLQQAGMIVLSSGERARLAHPDARVFVEQLSGAARLLLQQPGGIERMQDARALLEIGLARYAAERATPADILLIEDALKANRRAMSDPVRFIQTDLAFHEAIARATHNTMFTALFDAVVAWLAEQRLVSLEAPGACKAAFNAHKKVFEAIRDRDAERAATAMQRHLTAVVKLYWSVRKADT